MLLVSRKNYFAEDGDRASLADQEANKEWIRGILKLSILVFLFAHNSEAVL